MRKKISILTCIMLFMSVFSGIVSAQDLTVDQVVAKANLTAYYAGDDGLSDVKMTIKDSRGRERNREFRILRRDVQDGGEQKFYVYFNKPADVAKMVYMVWKNIDKDDDRWLYLPALDLVRRIAATDKRSSFVGSHFVYEDVSGRGLQADSHEIVETTEEYYKIKNIPKEGRGVEFAYYFVWVRKNDFLPFKSEYYDADDKLIRSIEALEIENVQGYPTVVKSVAKDLQRGGETQMEFSNIKYDNGIDDEVFAERYLRRPPVQWIK